VYLALQAADSCFEPNSQQWMKPGADS